MAILPAGRVLAVDWGERRFGIALSDESQIIASPLTTLTRRAGKRFPIPQILALVAEHRPIGLIVGLPLEGSGAEGPKGREVRELAAILGARTYLPVELVDERMTTALALTLIKEQEGSTRGRRGAVDALAAAVLLQGFLDARREAGKTGRGEDGR